MKRHVALFAISLCLVSLTSCSKAPEKTAKPVEEKKASAPTTPKMDLAKMPGTALICKVSGSPITVDDYRRGFKLEEIQLQAAVSSNPQMRAGLLESAKKNGLTLTEGEKTRLISLARQNKAADAKSFERYLRENKLTQADFDKQILDVGLAFKAAEIVLQQTFFNELVNRQMLYDAGRNAGLVRKANTQFSQFKKTPNYNQIAQLTGFSKDELNKELLKQEVITLYIDRLRQKAPVSNAEIRELYNKNLKVFQMPERIRLSEIIIPAPMQDNGPIMSLKTQVKRAQPTWTEAQVEQGAAQVLQQQKAKAETVMVQAKTGASFAQLANANDPRAQKTRSGGDIGYRQKSQLPKEIADILWKMKAGEVMPQMLQDPIGFHIMKVTGHEPAGPAPISDVREYLKANIVMAKGGEYVTKWLEDQRKTAKIEFAPEFQALLADQTKLGALPPGAKPGETPVAPAVPVPATTDPAVPNPQ